MGMTGAADKGSGTMCGCTVVRAETGPWAMQAAGKAGTLQVSWLAPGVVRVTAALRTRVWVRAGDAGWWWLGTQPPSLCLSAALLACS